VPGLPVLILSQYVEQLYAAELLSDRAGGVGYLLKDRVGEVKDFVAAVRRVAAGGTAMDPDVVAQLLGAGRQRHRLSALTLPPSDDDHRRGTARRSRPWRRAG
jgi:DNA-binding NarL/FixJ family response regulator